MVSAGQGRQALKLLKYLADAATHPSESARIAIASASAAQSVSEFGQQREFASSAESIAEQISSPLLQADALLLEGIALHRIGDRQAIKKLKKSFELFDQHDDKHGAASAIGAIAKTYVDTGDLDTADEKIDEAIELSKSIDNERLQNRFLSQRGEVLIFRGKFEQAIQLLQETKTKYEELGDQLNAAGIGLTLANVMARRGKSEEAHQLIREARKTFQSVGNRQGEARSWGQEGAMHGRAGDPTKARPQFQRALELFREVGDRRGEAICLGDLANTYSAQGDLETAGKYLSQSLELHRQLASRRGPSTIMYNLGLLYIRTGRAQDALALLREAHESFEQRGNTMNACFVQRKFGDLQMRFGELDGAEETLKQCLATARSAGSKSVEASALASLADIMVYRGQPEQAIELHKQSRGIRQELKQDGNVAANNLELARIAMRDKRFDDAKEWLRQSKDVMTMNTQGWDWIYRAAEAQLTARQANNKPQTSTNLAPETEINASDTLIELEEFLQSRESQDVSMELALNLEKARLMAALNDPRTIDTLDQVIIEAQSLNLQANQLEAQVEKLEFQAQTNQVDRQALERVQTKAKELGFDGLSLRLDELSQ
jgi:tetratricopeptide (TPR) repeat protein